MKSENPTQRKALQRREGEALVNEDGRVYDVNSAQR